MTTNPVEARIGVLETRVAGIEDGIKSIVTKLDARSGINWAPISILVTVLAIVGGMGFSWINAGQGRLEGLIAKVEGRTESFVPRVDLDARFNVITQRRDDLQRLTDARIERVERDVDTVQKTLVPRGEHDERAAAQRQKDEGIQRQIDSLRKDLSDLNTPRDTIQAMQRRIDELERGRRPPG